MRVSGCWLIVAMLAAHGAVAAPADDERDIRKVEAAL